MFVSAVLSFGAEWVAAQDRSLHLARHEVPTTDDLHTICFVDTAHGWIVTHSTGRILRTTDGGAVWKSVAAIEPGYIEWISFRDREHGWLCGEQGRLCSTTDGGGSWQCHEKLGDDVVLSVVHFWDNDKGFASGMRIRDRSSVLFVTDDGGRTWRDRGNAGVGHGMTDALVAISPTSVLMGGFDTLWRADHRGAEWSSVPIHKGAVVRGLTVQQKGSVWAVGHRGLVLVSRDNGTSWQHREPFTDALLRGIVFTSDDDGLVFGNRDGQGQTLWYTENAGDTWTPLPGDFPELHRAAVTPERLWLVGAGGALYTLDLSSGDSR